MLYGKPEDRFDIIHEQIDLAEAEQTFIVLDLFAGPYNVVADGLFTFGENREETEVSLLYCSHDVDAREIESLTKSFFLQLWTETFEV